MIRGAESAAKAALNGARLTAAAQLVVVNGAPGVVAFNDKGGEPRSIVAFAIRKGRITEITVFADPVRLRQLDIVSSAAARGSLALRSRRVIDDSLVTTLKVA